MAKHATQKLALAGSCFFATTLVARRVQSRTPIRAKKMEEVLVATERTKLLQPSVPMVAQLRSVA